MTNKTINEAGQCSSTTNASNIFTDVASPNSAVTFLRRVSFGIAPAGHYSASHAGDMAKFKAGGSTLASQVSSWVNQQLEVGISEKDKLLNDVVRTDIGDRILKMNNDFPCYYALDLTVSKEWTMMFRRRDLPEGFGIVRGLDEVETLYLERAVYSEFQLFERLALFWHDHFNVCPGEVRSMAALWGSWDRLIRQHVLGNFYLFLRATAEHPLMLQYLNNNTSVSKFDKSPNENYAREIFELHTLGSIHYLGIMDQKKVPVYTKADQACQYIPDRWIGEPKWYVDDDVYAASRLLTGWQIDDGGSYAQSFKGNDTGNFKYNLDVADKDKKTILLHLYPKDGFDPAQIYEPFRDNLDEDGKLLQGRHMIYQLATHPGTAKHIAIKLTKHFLSDNPPEAVVNAVAKTFLENVDSDDQLKQCYITLFNRPEMRDKQSWGRQKARPFEMVTHACRAMGCQRDFRPIGRGEVRNANHPLAYQYLQSEAARFGLMHAGHRNFKWQPPDGYPSDATFWMSSASIIQTWRLIDTLTVMGGYANVNSERAIMRILPITLEKFPNPADQTPRNIVRFWAGRVWGFTPSDAVIAPIVAFFCRPPDGSIVQAWQADFPISDGKINGKKVDSNVAPHYWANKLRIMVSGLMTHPYAMLR